MHNIHEHAYYFIGLAFIRLGFWFCTALFDSVKRPTQRYKQNSNTCFNYQSRVVSLCLRLGCLSDN